MLTDPRLSLKSKGLLALMLSFPDGWTYYMAHLETLSSDGRDAHRSAAKELIALGYVIRHRTRDEAGRIATTAYEVADYVIRVPDGTSSTDGFSGAGVPPTSNTDLSKTEDLKPLSTSSTPSLKIKDAPKEEHQNGQVQTLVDIWNEHRGVLPSTKVVSSKRTAALVRFMREAGGFDAAKEVMERGTKFVAQDDFWRKKNYGLDILLAGDKIFQKAESYEAKNDSVRPANVSVGDKVRVRVMIGARSTVVKATVSQVTAAQVIVLDADGLERRVPHRDVVDAP